MSPVQSRPTAREQVHALADAMREADSLGGGVTADDLTTRGFTPHQITRFGELAAAIASKRAARQIAPLAA